MPRPVSIIASGGLPVTNTTADIVSGVPLTPVVAPLFGEPITLVAAGAKPVVLVNEDLTIWSE